MIVEAMLRILTNGYIITHAKDDNLQSRNPESGGDAQFIDFLPNKIRKARRPALIVQEILIINN